MKIFKKDEKIKIPLMLGSRSEKSPNIQKFALVNEKIDHFVISLVSIVDDWKCTDQMKTCGPDH